MTEQRVTDEIPQPGATPPPAAELIQPAVDGGAQDPVPEAWLAPFQAHAKKIDEFHLRLQADAELLDVLQFSGFRGPAWEELATVLAEYGYQVVRGWLISGLIFARCAAKGISVGTTTPGNRPPLQLTDVDELTQDTISSAIEKFRDKVLIPKKWTPAGGATLKTYFVGQALFRFGDTFRSWMTVHRRRRTLHDLDHAVAAPSTFEPETMFVGHRVVEELLEAMKEDLRAIVVLTAHGYEQAEVAEMLGISTRAVEGKLYRYRQRMGGRHAVA